MTPQSVATVARAWPEGVSRRLASLAPARPTRLRLERPALSVSFDGFTRSAGELGGPALAAHGVRATFFASAGMIGAQRDDDDYFDPALMLSLARAGHEIGDASYSYSDLSRAKDDDALADIERNAATLRAMGLTSTVRALTYPGGRARRTLKFTLPARISCARGRTPGLNHSWADLMDLHAYRLADTTTFPVISAAIERARRLRAWLIVYAGAVSDTPGPNSVTPATLDALINVAKRAGFDIQPIGAVAARAAGAQIAWL